MNFRVYAGPNAKRYTKAIGYFLLVVSTIAWIILPVIPFLDLSGKEIAAYSSAVFIFAEVTWWACVPLLGKEFIDKGKKLYRLLLDKIKEH